MECNKDEAMRAKDIAVKKFSEKDFAGAKKFALKAQSLYNGLEGVAQLITTLEVYLSAQNKINGEMDMYGILGVTALADEETLKKHYRKLVLQLHPDKNKFIGADGAFQLVTEAFNLLSDKAKRLAYNTRRNIQTFQQKVPSQYGVSTGFASSGHFQPKFPTYFGVSVPPFSAGRTDQKVPTQGGVFGASNSSQQKVRNQSGSSAPRGTNGYHKHPGPKSSREKVPKSSSQKASPSTQSAFKKGDTFWTMCTRCKMQYEYMRNYLNQILKCPHCLVGFAAVEVPAPSNLSSILPQHQLKPSLSSEPKIPGFDKLSGAVSARWSPLFGTTTYSSSAHNSSISVKAINESLAREKVKRESEAAKAAGKRKNNDDPGFVSTGEVPLKKMREMDDRTKNVAHGIPSQSGTGNQETGAEIPPSQSIGNSEVGRGNCFAKVKSKSNNVDRELSAVELRKMLSQKALMEIRTKIKECKSAGEARIAAKGKEKAKRRERQKSKLTNDVAMQQDLGNKNTEWPPASFAEQEAVEMVTMTVPDPDFHVFDMDRSESCFGENQVWAAYDNDDGMPRFYAMIHEVISKDPFKVRLSWLNSHNNNEFGPLDWEGLGFIKSCGDFWIGRHEMKNSLNIFSHKVSWIRGYRGSVWIYPQKGEIWALYKNWSPDWNQDTPDDIVHAYTMVEVLDDYNEDEGVRVASLVKADGFLTVFRKQSNPMEVKQIQKEEMFRFSHQVPSHVLTGEEGPNAPKGYVELDPAATPAELLQVFTSGIKDPATGSSSIVAA